MNMSYVCRVCCILTLLVLVSESRHLTGKISDAATKHHKSLISRTTLHTESGSRNDMHVATNTNVIKSGQAETADTRHGTNTHVGNNTDRVASLPLLSNVVTNEHNESTDNERTQAVNEKGHISVRDKHSEVGRNGQSNATHESNLVTLEGIHANNIVRQGENFSSANETDRHLVSHSTEEANPRTVNNDTNQDTSMPHTEWKNQRDIVHINGNNGKDAHPADWNNNQDVAPVNWNNLRNGDPQMNQWGNNPNAILSRGPQMNQWFKYPDTIQYGGPQMPQWGNPPNTMQSGGPQMNQWGNAPDTVKSGGSHINQWGNPPNTIQSGGPQMNQWGNPLSTMQSDGPQMNQWGNPPNTIQSGGPQMNQWANHPDTIQSGWPQLDTWNNVKNMQKTDWNMPQTGRSQMVNWNTHDIQQTHWNNPQNGESQMINWNNQQENKQTQWINPLNIPHNGGWQMSNWNNPHDMPQATWNNPQHTTPPGGPQIVTGNDPQIVPQHGGQQMANWNDTQNIPQTGGAQVANWNNPQNIAHPGGQPVANWKSHQSITQTNGPPMINRTIPSTRPLPETDDWNTANIKPIHNANTNYVGLNNKFVRASNFQGDNHTVTSNSVQTEAVVRNSAGNVIQPKVTVFIDEKNSEHGNSQRLMISSGKGVIKSRTINSAAYRAPVPITHKKEKAVSGSNSEITTNDDHHIALGKAPVASLVEKHTLDDNYEEAPVASKQKRTIPISMLKAAHDIEAHSIHAIGSAETVDHVPDSSNNNETSAPLAETSADNTENDQYIDKSSMAHVSISAEDITIPGLESANGKQAPSRHATESVQTSTEHALEHSYENNVSSRENNESTENLEKVNVTKVPSNQAIGPAETNNEQITGQTDDIGSSSNHITESTEQILKQKHDIDVHSPRVVEPTEANNTHILDTIHGTEETTTTATEARTTEVLHNQSTTGDGPRDSATTTTATITTTNPPYTRVIPHSGKAATEIDGKAAEQEVDHLVQSLGTSTTEMEPEDVPPLNIFTNDITYQRFPKPMSLTTLKSKVLGKRFKKLYVLEESEKKLFRHVRQLEAMYTIEDGTLYVSLLFRFVYSRRCQEIEKFKMGKLVGNTDIAMFEKEKKDGRTERILFFSERPDDYVFFMSCTDMKTSPYACRDSYYITLDSAHDPPNQFPWASAAQELDSKMRLTFEDPRFIFNFVLLPCARKQ